MEQSVSRRRTARIRRRFSRRTCSIHVLPSIARRRQRAECDISVIFRLAQADFAAFWTHSLCRERLSRQAGRHDPSSILLPEIDTARQKSKMSHAGIKVEGEKMAKCPFCEKTVVLDGTGAEKRDEVHKEVKGAIRKEIMYSCPHCDRVLGFGYFHGGFWAGRP
jgi:hypothetical protein